LERIGLKNNLSGKTLREVVHGDSWLNEGVSSGGRIDSRGSVHTFASSGRKSNKQTNKNPCR